LREIALRTVNRYEEVSTRIQRLGGFEVTCPGHVHDMPFYVLSSPCAGPGAPSVCLAAGIHGDEPAGVEGLLRALEQPALWEGLRALVFPCANPSGLVQGTRENADGVDLNRQFHSEAPPAEVALVKRRVDGERFDLFAYFHEDDEANGFYVYETAEDGRPFGPALIDAVRARIPPDSRPLIDDHTNRGGILRHDDWRTRVGNWSMGLYLHRQGVRHLVTVETPSRLPFEERVAAQVTVIGLILERTRERPSDRSPDPSLGG
jgi:hypothetical protein